MPECSGKGGISWLSRCMNVKHSVKDGSQVVEIVEPHNERTEPINFGRLKILSEKYYCPIVWWGATCLDHSAFGKNYNEKVGGVQRTLFSRWKRKVPFSVVKIDDHVKHNVRELHQEAHHVANLGTFGKTKIKIEVVKITEEWKAIWGYFDRSNKDDVRSWCGIVIKAVEREKWITISKIAVPWRYVRQWLRKSHESACWLTEALHLLFILDNQSGKPSSDVFF